MITVKQALHEAILLIASKAASKGLTLDIVFLNGDDAHRECSQSVDKLKGLLVGVADRAPENMTVCITIMDGHVYSHIRLPETNVVPIRGPRNVAYGLRITG